MFGVVEISHSFSPFYIRVPVAGSYERLSICFFAVHTVLQFQQPLEQFPRPPPFPAAFVQQWQYVNLHRRNNHHLYTCLFYPLHRDTHASLNLKKRIYSGRPGAGWASAKFREFGRSSGCSSSWTALTEYIPTRCAVMVIYPTRRRAFFLTPNPNDEHAALHSTRAHYWLFQVDTS